MILHLLLHIDSLACSQSEIFKEGRNYCKITVTSSPENFRLQQAIVINLCGVSTELNLCILVHHANV